MKIYHNNKNKMTPVFVFRQDILSHLDKGNKQIMPQYVYRIDGTYPIDLTYNLFCSSVVPEDIQPIVFSCLKEKYPHLGFRETREEEKHEFPSQNAEEYTPEPKKRGRKKEGQ